MRYLRSILILGVAFCIGGCGGNRASITGTVTYKNQPVKEGTIMFLPEGGRPATGKIVDGKIVDVTTTQSNDGAPVGKHKVQITAVEGGKDMYAKTRSLIPEKYGNPEKSGLTAEIKPGQNELTFDLKD